MDDVVHYTEQELLAQLAEGDRSAFSRIYTQYYPKVFRYLHIVTKSKESAEEILQDIFLKLWIKRTTLTGIQSLESYLFTMAKNRVFDRKRHDKIASQYLKASHSVETVEDIVGDALILKEYHALTVKAISLMPARRQEIFRLNAQGELTAKEIAEKLHLSLPVVKRQLYEAQHFIREYLREHGDILLVLIFSASIMA